MGMPCSKAECDKKQKEALAIVDDKLDTKKLNLSHSIMFRKT